MMSEWLKVMLEEIERKKAEASEARADLAAAVVVESPQCAGEKEVGDAAQYRDKGRGGARS